MIESVNLGDITLAVILRADYHAEGIQFFHAQRFFPATGLHEPSAGLCHSPACAQPGGARGAVHQGSVDHQDPARCAWTFTMMIKTIWRAVS